MMEILPQLFIFLLAGGLIGLSSSLFGIGGGALAIPVFLFVYPELSPVELTATSFALVLFNATLNTMTFWKRGMRPNWPLTIVFGVGLFLGVPIGSSLLMSLDKRAFELIFGIVLLILAFRNLQGPLSPDQQRPIKKPGVLHAVVGIVIGVMAGLTGIGGGTMILPALMLTTHLPLKQLPLHSHLIMICAATSGLLFLLNSTSALVVSDLGLLSQVSLGPVHLGLVLIIMLGALPTTRLGARALQKWSPRTLKYLFSAFLFLVSVSFLLP
jgi:uncharacterized protein